MSTLHLLLPLLFLTSHSTICSDIFKWTAFCRHYTRFCHSRFSLFHLYFSVIDLLHGSYKQKLVEFKAFQGFSKTNMTIFKALSRHEVGVHDKNLNNFSILFSPSLYLASKILIITEYFLSIF